MHGKNIKRLAGFNKRSIQCYKSLLVENGVEVEGCGVVNSCVISYPESPSVDALKKVPNTNIMQVITNKPINANL